MVVVVGREEGANVTKAYRSEKDYNYKERVYVSSSTGIQWVNKMGLIRLCVCVCVYVGLHLTTIDECRKCKEWEVTRIDTIAKLIRNKNQNEKRGKMENMVQKKTKKEWINVSDSTSDR